MISPTTPRLTAIPFDTEIAKLTERFTGREWVFEEIDNWLKHQDERFFVLTGEPGVGKSAIAARLTQTHQNIAAYHFCIAGESGTIQPNCVLLSLAAKLVEYFPDYAETLANIVKPLRLSVKAEINAQTIKDSVVRGVVIENLYTQLPQETLDIVLRRSLANLPGPPEEPVLIMIDSLDEAVTYSDKENLVTLLSGVGDLPTWVRLIVTTRPEEPRVLSYLKTLKPYFYHLDELSQKSLKDIHLYVDERVAGKAIRVRLATSQTEAESLVEQITDLSKGNFLYTKVLLDDIESGGQPLDNLDALPKSLDEFYHKFLMRLRSEWETKYQIIFEILTVTKTTVTNKELINFIPNKPAIERAPNETQLNQALGVVKQFLDVVPNNDGQSTYQLFHTSLRDYLLEQERDPVFWCSPKDGHRWIVEYCWQYYPNDWRECDCYGLQYLADHLADLANLGKPNEASQYWERLYELARNKNFTSAQRYHFPDKPNLPLKTIKLALQGKAKADDPEGMAEFLLLHAGLWFQTTQESPLDALRAGNVTRAWALADQLEIEQCILWYLLLVWALETQSNSVAKMEQVQETLARLQLKNLPHLNQDLQVNIGVDLLAQILFVVEQEKVPPNLSKKFLNDEGLSQLCKQLIGRNALDKAFRITQQIDMPNLKSKVLGTIGAAQARAHQFDAARSTFSVAIETARQMEDSYFKATSLGAIAAAQAQAHQFDAAESTLIDACETVIHLDDVMHQEAALRTIGIAQAQARQFEVATLIVQKIEDSFFKLPILAAIAVAQAQDQQVEAAMETAQQIDHLPSKAEALGAIAVAQAQAQQVEAAIETIQQIEDPFFPNTKTEKLIEVVKILAQTQQVEMAIEIVQQIHAPYYKAEALVEIATILAQSQRDEAAQSTFKEAFETIKQINDPTLRVNILRAIAVALAQVQQTETAQSTFEVAIKTTQQISCQLYKDEKLEALSEIAVAQAQAQQVEEAIMTAQQIDVPSSKTDALKAIAVAQAQAQQVEAAIETIQQIDNLSSKAEAFGAIAVAQAQAQQVEAAIETIQQIDNLSSKTDALRAIAAAQILAQQFEAAIVTAQQIDAPFSQLAALRDIAVAQAKARQFQAAKVTIQEIHEPVYKVEAIGAIATAQAQAHQFDAAQCTLNAAIEIANQIDLPLNKAYAFREIALVQVQTQQYESAQASFNAAIEAAQQYEEPTYYADALKAIATAQAQAQQFKAATETIQQIDDPIAKIDALEAIARVQAKTQQFESAQSTFVTAIDFALKNIQELSQRAIILKNITCAMAVLGLNSDALSTADKILVNRNKHLPEIAAAFVEVGDRDSFKYLLISSIDSPDAAYKMCGYLAKLYPEQASAIAEVVSATVQT